MVAVGPKVKKRRNLAMETFPGFVHGKPWKVMEFPGWKPGKSKLVIKGHGKPNLCVKSRRKANKILCDPSILAILFMDFVKYDHGIVMEFSGLEIKIGHEKSDLCVKSRRKLDKTLHDPSILRILFHNV